MKTKPLFLTLILVLVLLASAAPAIAAPREPVGERISLFFGGEREFPAGAPFYIKHGWSQSSEDDAIGVFDFELEVDGVLRKENFKLFSAESGDPDTLNRIWVFNFPEGMTGMHTFTGHWYAPCQYAVDQLGFLGPCATPNAKVENKTKTLVVTFFP